MPTPDIDDAHFDEASELSQCGVSEGAVFDGLRVAFVGRLGGVSRREAYRLVRRHGGVPIDRVDLPLNVVVLGADELPLTDETRIDEPIRELAASGKIEIISETQFWHRLGMVESDTSQIRRLYTPAMLAQLLGVSIAVIRRWHRRGLIVPARKVHRLPYFDFQEVATARRLAELLASGATPDAIERQLAQLARLVPEVERPLAQLSVIVKGRELFLRQGAGLIDPGGQMRLDFESGDANQDAQQEPTVLPVSENLPTSPSETVSVIDSYGQRSVDLPDWEDLLDHAADLEDLEQLNEAIEVVRVALIASGPRAEVNFRLAELLYRVGEIEAARERYSIAIELDEDYVEARANLGCVLAEKGQTDLAIAAFEGALASHPDYPDVHYHLARLLDEGGATQRAENHWREFLELSPDSPWAEEARLRLEAT